ncbi:hypothetical protein GCM10011391_12360 [Pullulanibacillus camelliae]|uniref:Uncharacterized protein n=1 Tax=Pullulanibacillus camelliae TaxID=1707096 RepID=A0A8J2VNR0_9BACL|nr:hypothetical protein [Pullulanibacillus camelliae]GGE35165.1 hypothetical protein GCM10011391_12360 [Pullulanibacillus camelliae]
MRKVFDYMTKEEKQKAVALFAQDIAELEKEQELEDEKGYPRVIKDAIEETIQRYKRDVEYLKNELKKQGTETES